MIINLTVEKRRELNKLLGMMRSPDKESVALGVDLFLSSDFASQLRSMWYLPRLGKEIPIYWYFNKAKEEMAKQKEHNYPESYSGLIIPIIESLLNGECKFKDSVSFCFVSETEGENSDPKPSTSFNF